MRLNRILSLVMLLFLVGFSLEAQLTQNIKVNQVGYYTGATKLASVIGTSASRFNLRDAVTGTTVFTAELSAAAFWDETNESVKTIDFTAFNQPGEYKLFVSGLGESYPFKINSDVLDEVSKEAVRYFYYNRASTALLPQYAGKFARPGGHFDTEVEVCDNPFSGGRRAGSVLSSPGGWYDAGDYNKYLLTAGISTYTLLSTYEQYPNYVTNMNLNIPESGNNLPDLLDECLYEINWLLTMQDTDGGVYTKLTNQGFGGFIMPDRHDDQNGPRYVCGKNTSATLQFAALLAAAYRIYEPVSAQLKPGERERWKTAALAAWAWAIAHPNIDAEQCGCGIETGAYPDVNQRDEFVWAAAELYLATGQISYYNRYNFRNQEVSVPNWQAGKESLGMISLLLNKDLLSGQALSDYDAILGNLTNRADRLAGIYQNHPYQIMMRNNWPWGSNGEAANQSFITLTAYRLTQNQTYLDAATSNIDYILGKNTTSYSWLTGFGTKQVKDAHHRVSGGDGIPEPVPGMVFGGAFERANGFVDASCCGIPSYANTEVTINWNAPFAFATIGLQSINRELQSAGFTLQITTLGKGSVTASPNQAAYALGDTVTLTAAPEVGHSFGQWSEGLSGGDPVRTLVVEGSRNITAIFNKHLVVPGVIVPTDYNLGGAGIAYLDNDVINQGDGPRPQEGVDTELRTPSGTNVGWINEGEWIEYTLEVQTAGTYSLSAEIASPRGNGGFRLAIDGQEVAVGTNFEVTQEWDVFENQALTNIALKKGVFTMRITMTQEGFNLGNLDFELLTVTSIDAFNHRTKRLKIYPNPVENYLHIEGYHQEIEITTLEGIKVGSYDLASGRISVAQFQPGVYLLHPQDKTYGVTKFIKY